jgi:hypothetical protein
LKSSTQGVNEGAAVTGILDIKTSKIYECNIRTLLHLGAQKLHLNRSDKILQNELDSFITKQVKNNKLNDETLNVLSLHAPGLYF